jgi:DNA polymerase-3 subunit gamma/tau
MELATDFRPKIFSHVFGQDDVIDDLRRLTKKKRVPHAIFFTGPSGTGKTTLARILAIKLGCNLDFDFAEMNCADIRGIDAVRLIRKQMGTKALGNCRLYLIDECHKLTNDAQNALLKMTEEPPNHVYFVFCSTDPHRVIKTIRNRFTSFALRPLTNQSIEEILASVCKRAKIKKPTADVLDKIAEHAEGSARQALVIWNKIFDLDEEEDQLERIASTRGEAESFELARMLLNRKRTWKAVVNLIEACNDDVETTRRVVLAYMASAMKKGNSDAYEIAECFRDPFYDLGKPGLVMACWEACH